MIKNDEIFDEMKEKVFCKNINIEGNSYFKQNKFGWSDF